jgi:DnaJ-domain-containing protein 1
VGTISSDLPVGEAMKIKNFYFTLGVEHSASVDDIKRAYRRLAHKYHPDVSDDPDGERKFQELGEAYRTLKYPRERSAYDRLLSRSQSIDSLQLNGVWLNWLSWMYWWSGWETTWWPTTDLGRRTE